MKPLGGEGGVGWRWRCSSSGSSSRKVMEGKQSAAAQMWSPQTSDKVTQRMSVIIIAWSSADGWEEEGVFFFSHVLFDWGWKDGGCHGSGSPAHRTRFLGETKSGWKYMLESRTRVKEVLKWHHFDMEKLQNFICNLHILSLKIYQTDYYCYLKWNMKRYLSNAVSTIKLFCLYLLLFWKLSYLYAKKVKVDVEKMLVDNNF